MKRSLQSEMSNAGLPNGIITVTDEPKTYKTMVVFKNMISAVQKAWLEMRFDNMSITVKDNVMLINGPK